MTDAHCGECEGLIAYLKGWPLRPVCERDSEHFWDGAYELALALEASWESSRAEKTGGVAQSPTDEG